MSWVMRSSPSPRSARATAAIDAGRRPGSRSRQAATTASISRDAPTSDASLGATSNSCGQRPSANPSNGSLPGQRLEQDHAEGPDVDARRDEAAGELLGSHVGRGPGAPPGLECRPPAQVAREPEVHDGGLVAAQHHVGRLEVAVDDAAVVGGLHAVGQRRPERAHVRLGQAAHPAQALGQAVARDALHHQVAAAGRIVAAEVEDRDEVRVVDGAGAGGLAQEGVDRRGGVAVALAAQQLDRHLVAEEPVHRGEDLAGATAADRFAELVVADDAARR